MLKIINIVLMIFYFICPVHASDFELAPIQSESRISVMASRIPRLHDMDLERGLPEHTNPQLAFTTEQALETSAPPAHENWYDRFAIKILKGAIYGWSTADTLLKTIAVGTSISSAIINGINLDQQCAHSKLDEAGTILPAAFAITAVLRSTTEFAIKERSKQLKYLLNQDQSSATLRSQGHQNDDQIKRLKLTIYAWHFLRTTCSTIAFCSASASGVAVGFSLRSPCYEEGVTKFGIALSSLFAFASILEISFNHVIKVHNKQLDLLQGTFE